MKTMNKARTVLVAHVMMSVPLVKNLSDLSDKFDRYPFGAVLLASKEDREVLHYFQKFHWEEHHETGSVCLLIIFERKYKNGEVRSIRYGKNGLEHGVPYDAARLLKVKFSDLPCLAVFDRIDISAQNLAILKLPGNEEELKKVIRNYVSYMEECRELKPGLRLSTFKKKWEGNLVKTSAHELLSDILKEAFSIGLASVLRAFRAS